MSEDQYLTFQIRKNGFGLPINRVREIIGYEEPVIVPLMPKWVSGIINLRGNSVPVIDLGFRLFGEKTELSRHTCFVIFSADEGKKEKLMGLMVDSVNEVVSFREEDLEEAPDIGHGIKADFLNGVGKMNSRFYLLLNMEQTLEDINSEDIHAAMAALTEKAQVK